MRAGPRLIEEDALQTYRGFVLDPFQREAMHYLDEGHSVLVAAPTGTGKTLIADHLIERVHEQGKRVVYTAPIKALSNQKFKEFKRLLGEPAVGILTGDVVLHSEAPILIMTTEIFRNLLHQDPGRVADVAYCIFDEIHYIDDPSRGSVWEESLIFMPAAMRFLGLSATIPNVEELAAWTSSVQGNPVHVVKHFERAVPLAHYCYEANLGITTLRQLQQRYERYARRLRLDEGSRLYLDFPHTTHLDLIQEIRARYLPCLFFTFSRRRCEVNANELAQRHDFLPKRDKGRVREVIERHVARYGGTPSVRLRQVRPLLERGIGYHHAGLMPLLKDIVEDLFEQRLLHVLYCTETFAVGLNFPCRTVCFEAVTKWDGSVFRPLSNREYFQMAGRAGRRGIDERGYVFTLVDFNFFVPREFPSMVEDEIEPLRSRFTLSYNSVLNLVQHYGDAEIRQILRKNFATYQREREVQRLKEQEERLLADLARLDTGEGGRKQRKVLERRLRSTRRQLAEVPAAERFVLEFQAKKRLLEALDYIRNGRLTARGEFASRINIQELLVTELFMAGFFHELDPDQLNALAVAVDYEPRKNEGRFPHNVLDVARIKRIAEELEKLELEHVGVTTVRFFDHFVGPAYKWSRGCAFGDLLRGAYLDEGDIVYTLRRAIDLLRQVRHACREDPFFAAKLQDCIERMDRNEVSIVL